MNSNLLSIILRAPFKIKPIKKLIVSPIITSFSIYTSIVLLLLLITKLMLYKAKN